ncbi:hypothetical protein N7G274_007365 [Stereocaulon virgatum]|uniref:Uncharacterized protein n=1 Tax=Stereocaulon virgatum TaxID=373712 RepID=A0ABR4A6F1_9LECA
MLPSIKNNIGVQVDGTSISYDVDLFHQGSIYSTEEQENGIATGKYATKPTPALHNVQEQFNIQGKVFLVTGGGQGLGLTMAEGLVESGAIVYCLDRRENPIADFYTVQNVAKELASRGSRNPGSIHYRQVDVHEVAELERITSEIAHTHHHIDGLVAAAAIPQVNPAIDYTAADVGRMMDINLTGVFMTATAVARRMLEYQCKGSIVLVASMSDFVANKGLLSSIYNSSKAALVQLARNLAMEWGKYGIRVNSLCPGHIVTPTVRDNFWENLELEGKWKAQNMLQRLASPEEFKGVGVFLCSQASSYMTGSALVIDGGHTAW